MFGLVKQFLSVFLAFLVLDYIWMVYVAQAKYLAWIGPIANVKDGRFDVKVGAALMVYAVLAMALQFFVLKNVDSLAAAAWQGAFLGFTVYAVFDLTNYALIKNYPLDFALMDMAWGTVLVGVVSASIFACKISM